MSIKRILDGGRVQISHIETLVNALERVIKDVEALKLYEIDITMMNPTQEYFKLALNAPIYLYDYLYTLHHYKGDVTQDELIALEQASYEENINT